MPTPRTRPLPGMVLISVPTAAWVTLVVVIWVLAAIDEPPPFGGFFSLGIGVAITSTLISVGFWAVGNAKAHVSTELATFYSMLSRRLDPLDAPTQPILRVVGTAPVSSQKPSEDAEEMTGYAKGYADGLSRKPIAGKVLPIEPRRT